MANPLRTAYRSAQRVDRELAALFGRYIGTQAHNPRGRILSAYRQARRAVLQVYERNGPRRTFEALDVLATLRETLYDVGSLALPLAEQQGQQSVAAQLDAYAAAGVRVQPAYQVPDRPALASGWRAAVDSHLDPVEALMLAEAEPYLIANEDGRMMGAMQPGPMQADAAFWLAYAAALGFGAWLLGRNGEREGAIPFMRQAIPAIDNRTTPCCLDVARRGQIVKFGEAFYTPEPPAFSRRQMWTPFHHWCRTSVVLYLEAFDDGITEELQRNAGKELSRRP